MVQVNAKTPEIRKRIKLSNVQDSFIFCEDRVTGFGGGWGCGKTLAGILKTLIHCKQPASRFLVGRLNYTDLRDSTLSQFRELYPNLPFIKSEYKLVLPNRSEILFRHLDSLHSLTNLNLSGFWIEQAEEVDEEVFTFLIGRLRKGDVGRREAFITFNMEGHNWIWKKRKEKGIKFYEATTFDNLENLPSDYLERLDLLPEAVKKRYLWGSWDEFEGMVWAMWNERVHVVEPFKVPKGWEEFIAIDHGLTHPTVAGKFAIDWDGNVFLTQEHYEAGQLVSYHAERVLEMMGEKEMVVVIDPSCRAKTGISGTSVVEEYQEHGVFPVPANAEVMAGINKVGEFLTEDPERIHPITRKKGSPRLFMFRNCVNTINEIPEYRWKKVRLGDVGEYKEKPMKRKDDCCDMLRYGIQAVDYDVAGYAKIDEEDEVDERVEYKQRAGFTGYVPMRVAR